MDKSDIIETTKVEFHQHACEVDGHYYECTEECVCICGLPMNGNDHSDCPVELRPCPEHSMPEAVSSEEQTEIEMQNAALAHCQCGCSDIDLSGVVGWCLHCDHVYANCTPEIENQHLAYDCPGVPETVKQAARARLAKRKM